MSEFGFASVEQGMRIAQARGAYLAADVANANSPGFVAKDVAVSAHASGAGESFAAALVDVAATGSSGVIEYAMGASAKNALSFRALADQERAMLHEFKIIAEAARR